MKIVQALGLCVAAAAVPLLGWVQQARADPVDLGAAGPNNFAVLSIGGGNVAMNGPGTTNGNVGVTGPGQLQLNSSNGNPAVAINGNVFLGDTASITHPQQVNGNIFTNQNALLNQAAQDALHASQVAGGLAATNPTKAISLNGGSQTITGGPGVNVLNLGSGGINLNGGATLTLNAPASGSFVINDPGQFNLTGGSKINLAGGLTPNNVLYNLTGNNQQVALNGGGGGSPGGPNAQISGVLLAPNSTINFSPGQDTPEIIGGKNINLVSGGQVTSPPTPPVPEPASLLLGAFGACSLAGYRLITRRKKGLCASGAA